MTNETTASQPLISDQPAPDAAQAGDEPMPLTDLWMHEDMASDATAAVATMGLRDVRAAYVEAREELALWKRRALEAAQVSPRATADVERGSKRLDVLIAMAPNSFELIDQKWYLLDPRGRIAGKGETKRDALDAAIATTKPGA